LYRFLQALLEDRVGQHGEAVGLLCRKVTEVAEGLHVPQVTTQPCLLFLALPANDLEHGFGVGRLFESLSKFGPMQKLGDIG
jgi:hypothetical protein